MRLGKKLKSGLKLGAKIGAGALAVAGGLFALGGKATPTQDFMSGSGSIANVSTADLDKLYPRSDSGRFDLPVIGGAKPRQQTPMPRSDSGRFDLPHRTIGVAKPRQQSTASIISNRVNNVPAGFIPPPTGNQNFVGGAIDPRFN